MLYIVPTPIGNLKDITLRALETLKAVDGIICEDSRRASILLNHYQIHKPLIILNDFNEYKTVPSLIEKLKTQDLALISDAGTPLISDPGYKLVRECLAQNIEVDSLPGAVSPIVALTLSGLPPDKFMFFGYLPEKPGARQTAYKNLLTMKQFINLTIIFFVSPHKLLKSIEEMKDFFGDINIILAKELTKIYQKVSSGKISEHLENFKKQPPKGEWIMLLNLRD